MPVHILTFGDGVVQRYNSQSRDSAADAKLFSARQRSVEREETAPLGVRRGFISLVARTVCFVS